MSIDYEADAQSAVAVTDGEVLGIAALCTRLLEQEQVVAQCEADLSLAKERLRKTQEEDLPNALRSAGVTAFKLADGSEVSVKEDLKASITVANQPAAFGWLEAHGAGALIKASYGLAFGKGEEAKAQELEALLTANGFTDYDLKRGVHAQTLAAYCREELAKGVEIPRDIFGIYEFRVAKVKAPKGKGKSK